MSREDLARKVYDASHLTGEFTLRSGAIASEYFDKYRFESDPALLSEVSEALAALVPPDVTAVAGLELGGIPLAVMVSQISSLPAFYVRKKAKTYGTCRQAEGGDLAGQRVAIIEDVVTSGGAIVEGVAVLRDAGAIVGVALCVIDRESGAHEALADEHLELRPLFSMTALTEAARGRGS
jgi:orotate phosphoribosyltransferase